MTKVSIIYKLLIIVVANLEYSFQHKTFDTNELLDGSLVKLISMARDMTSKAYAPYSSFYVGAALLLSDGSYIGGCNQENASYPLCMCAERVALYSYGASLNQTHIVALAISANNPNKPLTDPCMPCGACRQVIEEFEQRQNKPIDLYLTANNLETIVYINGINHILPQAFNRADLI